MIATISVVRCDGPLCGASSEPFNRAIDGRREMLAILRAKGWTRTHAPHDLCPKCSKKSARRVAKSLSLFDRTEGA